MQTIYIFFLLIFSSLVTQAQFKGIWNGYIDDNEGSGTSGYLINITDEGDGVVSGETYIYGNSILKFLGKLDFIGTIEGNGIKIMELKLLINRKPSPIHFICFKDLDLKLTKKNKYKKFKNKYYQFSRLYYICINVHTIYIWLKKRQLG